MQYFISDTHFFHAELLTSQHFSPRPFTHIEAEHLAMMTAWNEQVKPTDTVYHLGDIALLNGIKPARKGYQMVLELLYALNGHLIFIKGNHDTRDLFKFLSVHNQILADGQPKFVFHDVGIILKANHHQFFLTHYPILFGKTQSSINLHGHIHHASVPIQENINIGVDSADLDYLTALERPPFGTPLSLKMIERIIQRKHDAFAKMR
ncbi:metallophosphoesterase [Weissella diestrammenae]|uniref:Metallophosphoesterase n=1 Tax=Weissella diestrammenae TaxID=1162633 RepID=A0A7G9T3Y1_9LACO|nr:metallophosphoesterase [Weissella diestrammenae]MCM0583002.1 metallophosphoesterase [Weissella diestrammenae]QNN74806.1 metallophosphoesterase [Weissella diestrammenae]